MFRRVLAILVAFVMTYSCATVAFATGDDLELLPADGYKKGDVDMDSKIDIKDVILVLKHTVGVISLTDEKCLLADMDKNGEADVKDAIYIQRAIVNATTPVKPTNPPNEYVDDNKPIELPFVPAM
ncbi:MAG: dockerin type I repeat-containing protein [Acutalibacteraceae bacterium]|nr:dockerin type I repeat-containing protein [Acutalibacteraceae bacterium]